MKKLLIIIIYVIGAYLLQAQESISIKGKTLQGHEAQLEYWLFKDDVDTIVAINYSEYVQMVHDLEEFQLQKARLGTIIKAKDELIAVFENYEKKADIHIVTQDSLINLADTLYLGYKGLYNDLKSIADIKTFSVLLGAGLNKYNQNNPGYIFDAGFEYNKIQLNYQFGNKYNGLTMRYRIPLF
ncbi:MAG: hypothetical protein KAT68_05785 [Bacteroidales bacterium]|nr:hypothetical protein [Bacteroidales bacterium]